jgi:imidazolonepropionase-like amidohydrolase
MVERFSGFLSVSDSLIKEFARATRVSGAWNCPTLALQVDGAVSSEGRQRLLARPEMQLLPKPLREWMTNDRFYTSAPPAVLEAIRSSVPVEFKVLRELATQGAPLIAGTDTPLLMSMPGFALHRELEVMTEAGLSPYEALRAATVNAARFLHREKSSGTIAPGMQADLILLDGDPLQDITRTRAIAGVMLRGQWLDRARLDSALQDLRRRNEKNL